MKRVITNSLKTFPFWFCLAIWIIHIYSVSTHTTYYEFGIHPRHWSEWYTLLTGPFIHSDWEHLFNNSYPIIICGAFIVLLFGRFSNIVFLFSYCLAGVLIFLFARSSTYHIGASGITYSWVFLLAASGFFRNDKISLGLGLAVALLYGSVIWGVFPIQPGVSWDGHLYGAIAGIITAYFFKTVNVQSNNDTETTEEDKDEFNYTQFSDTPYAYIKRKFPKDEEE